VTAALDVHTPKFPGLLRAILDAIYGEDDTIDGVSVTRLRADLTEDADSVLVETTRRFGQYHDTTFDNEHVALDALFIVGGEIIYATDRTETSFSSLTRGLEGSGAHFHPAGTLVYDYSRNRSALDLVRRGLFVNWAQGVDLDTVGRNLGVPRCRGLTSEQYREIVRRTAYMAKTPADALRQVLDVLYPDPGQYELLAKPSQPHTVTVLVHRTPFAVRSLRGKFFLNGGERQVSDSATTVTVRHAIHQVLSVVADTPLARMGFPGPDLYPGGSFNDVTVTLGATLVGAGVPLIVNYGAFKAHYLALDENVQDHQDMFAYLSDDTQLANCLLDHVKAAGVRVDVKVVP
jgi:hypothetical protein